MDLSTLVLALLALVAGIAVGWQVASSRTGAALRAAETGAATARAELDAAQAAHAERVAALRSAEEAMSAHFRSLAAEALAANTSQFLGLAEQRLQTAHVSGAADLAQRQDAVRALVQPLTETIARVQQELTTAEKERLVSASALQEQLRGMREASESLRSQTGDLVTALRSSQVRGTWGELQLRRVVEASGMLRHVDFVEQDHVRTDDGALRPDLVVRLAGGKHVVVDAKVAFLGYLEAQQATDPAVRATRLAAHARHFRSHVDALAAKQYWEQFAPAPEFVVMFVPAEAFLSAALEQDPGLLEHAFARDVVIATPMTLVALLRTVAYAWRQEALAENAQRVLTLGRELHGRLATMGGHLARLGRQIDGAATAYNRTVASLETRVLVSARRFAELEVVDAELDSPKTVSTSVTAVTAPELVDGVPESEASAESVAPDADARADDKAATGAPVGSGRLSPNDEHSSSSAGTRNEIEALVDGELRRIARPDDLSRRRDERAG